MARALWLDTTSASGHEHGLALAGCSVYQMLYWAFHSFPVLISFTFAYNLYLIVVCVLRKIIIWVLYCTCVWTTILNFTLSNQTSIPLSIIHIYFIFGYYNSKIILVFLKSQNYRLLCVRVRGCWEEVVRVKKWGGRWAKVRATEVA